MSKRWPTLDDFIASFTPEEQAEYERLAALADKEAEGLKELRRMVRRTQVIGGLDPWKGDPDAELKDGGAAK